uniref:Uncharacterized protein n=1 Tax=Rhizophora mucronata TaxID=61149 RepID=A0A2P2N5Z4_RHIMU
MMIMLKKANHQSIPFWDIDVKSIYLKIERVSTDKLSTTCVGSIAKKLINFPVDLL